MNKRCRTRTFKQWTKIFHKQDQGDRFQLFNRGAVAHLAISALLFASSAIWLSSLKCGLSVNILVSGGCKPCNVLCACAHWSSRCSFPKSFCLVKAIYKTRETRHKMAKEKNHVGWNCSSLSLCNSYPLLNNKIPSSSTQHIANEELYQIKWDVKDDVVKPDHTSPTPSNPFNCSKAPICVNRD